MVTDCSPIRRSGRQPCSAPLTRYGYSRPQPSLAGRAGGDGMDDDSRGAPVFTIQAGRAGQDKDRGAGGCKALRGKGAESDA